MGKIIWAPSAVHNIELIAEFISRDSPDNITQNHIIFYKTHNLHQF